MNQERPHTHDSHCATDCETSKRNRYFRGKNLKVEEFQTEQAYFIERRRLINRAISGWGVVHGLAVDAAHREPTPGHSDGSPEETRLVVRRGLALDRHGRELVVLRHDMLRSSNTFILDRTGESCRSLPVTNLEAGRYILAAHYAERRIGDTIVGDPCECQRHEKRYVCEAVLFSLRRHHGEGCPCGEAPCQATCDCGTHDSCGHRSRGPHACLSHWLTHADIAETPGPLQEWGDWGVAVDDGVDLACVQITCVEGDCDPTIMGRVEDRSGPRRLVKNNDLLYGLITGCDLTHIDWTSWRSWHRSSEPVAWEEFAEKFQPDGLTDFSVVFSRPVLKRTLSRDVVAITVFTTDKDTGWRLARRIPVHSLVTETRETMPADLTDRFAVKVGARWFNDEMSPGAESWLNRRIFDVEIEIRGDLILDCHWQAVDANSVGLRATPSGNGTPGGTYFSSFRVHHHRPHREHHEPE